MLILFHLNASTGKNLCKFLLIKKMLVIICPAFRIKSIKQTYHIGISIQQETEKQGQNDFFEKGKGLS